MCVMQPFVFQFLLEENRRQGEGRQKEKKKEKYEKDENGNDGGKQRRKPVKETTKHNFTTYVNVVYDNYGTIYTTNDYYC
uniref:Uncharacterized protein n=1 Tax=Romanomermis culicivorax TaxID=13658 RepID=A0A915KM62_ROMCU